MCTSGGESTTDESNMKGRVMEKLSWVFDDGGRSAAGFKGRAGDCVVRAVSIAFVARDGGDPGVTYKAVYKHFQGLARGQKWSPRRGVPTKIFRRALLDLGFRWTPIVKIGSSKRLSFEEVQQQGDIVIVRIAKHLSAIVRGCNRDTFDPRQGRPNRCVYGFFSLDKK